MNPLMLIKAAPWFIAALLALGLAIMTNLYMGKRDELVKLEAQVRTLGELAEKEKARIEAIYDENLKKVKAKNEAELPRIKRDAVATYKLRYPIPSCSTVPNAPSGQQVDDGTGREQLVTDDAFVRNCTTSALKVRAFQMYCIENNCPIKE